MNKIVKHNVFYTPVWLIKGDPEILEIIDELKKGCYHLQEKQKSEYHSNIGGYQSKVFVYKEFHPKGMDYINRILYSLCEEKYVTKEWMISKLVWWFNINKKGNLNMPHIHIGSDISMVLYLTDGELVLQEPNIAFCNPKLNIDPTVVVGAKKGDVAIFPSNVQHCVMPHEGEEDRMSISFDVSLKGNNDFDKVTTI